MSIKNKTSDSYLNGLPKIRQIGQQFGPTQLFMDWLDKLPYGQSRSGAEINPHDHLRHGHKPRAQF